jgi:hypothetical protein
VSELHVPRHLVTTDTIPLLGAGKTDYSAAQALMEKELNVPEHRPGVKAPRGEPSCDVRLPIEGGPRGRFRGGPFAWSRPMRGQYPGVCGQDPLRYGYRGQAGRLSVVYWNSSRS